MQGLLYDQRDNGVGHTGRGVPGGKDTQPCSVWQRGRKCRCGTMGIDIVSVSHWPSCFITLWAVFNTRGCRFSQNSM